MTSPASVPSRASSASVPLLRLKKVGLAANPLVDTLKVDELINTSRNNQHYLSRYAYAKKLADKVPLERSTNHQKYCQSLLPGYTYDLDHYNIVRIGWVDFTLMLSRIYPWMFPDGFYKSFRGATLNLRGLAERHRVLPLGGLSANMYLNGDFPGEEAYMETPTWIPLGVLTIAAKPGSPSRLQRSLPRFIRRINIACIRNKIPLLLRYVFSTDFTKVLLTVKAGFPIVVNSPLSSTISSLLPARNALRAVPAHLHSSSFLRGIFRSDWERDRADLPHLPLGYTPPPRSEPFLVWTEPQLFRSGNFPDCGLSLPWDKSSSMKATLLGFVKVASGQEECPPTKIHPFDEISNNMDLVLKTDVAFSVVKCLFARCTPNNVLSVHPVVKT